MMNITQMEPESEPVMINLEGIIRNAHSEIIEATVNGEDSIILFSEYHLSENEHLKYEEDGIPIVRVQRGVPRHP